MRAAAIQMEAVVGDLDANLELSERLAEQAAADGAEWIALPEFFTTGIGFVPELADAALAPDGAATELLLDLAKRHGVTVGGSFLCRDADGEVRNAYLLATPDGIAGRHDKDLPTMWENSFYVGGDDDGVIEAGELTVGAALCWELMRTQTVRRLAGRIDLAIGGSGWWSVPPWPPAAITRRIEARNAAIAWRAIESFATYVGAPFIHAAHAGSLECAMPWTPVGYRGHFQGGAVITDATARSSPAATPPGGRGASRSPRSPRAARSRPPSPEPLLAASPPARLGGFTWDYQRIHGRRWYRRHTSGRPAAEPPRPGSGSA